jgi:hypothetical protein
MPRYVVKAEMTISVSATVEAPSKKAALDEARQRAPMSFCYGCSQGNPEEERVTSGELDGEPVKLKAEADE